MAHATGSRRQLIYEKEASFKASVLDGKVLRNTGDSINLTKNTLTSAELSGDRAIRFLRHGNETVSGDVSFEFAYADFDDLMASSLASTWQNASILTLTGIAADTNTITIGDDIYEFIDGSIVGAGNIEVDISSSAVASDAIDALILASSAAAETDVVLTKGNFSDTTCELVASGTLTVAISTTETCTNGSFSSATIAVSSASSTAGVLKQGILDIETYTFEKGFQDIGQYITYKGCAVNTFSIDMASDAIITGSVGLIGAGANDFTDESYITIPAEDGTLTDASSNEPFTSHQIDGVVKIDNTNSCLITAFNLSVDNGITANYSFCSNEAASITPDRINVTGSVTILFENEAEVAKFIQEVETSLVVRILDPANNSYNFSFPKIKYTGGDIAVSGGGVISISLPFQALYDDTAGSALIITRTDAAAYVE